MNPAAGLTGWDSYGYLQEKTNYFAHTGNNENFSRSTVNNYEKKNLNNNYFRSHPRDINFDQLYMYTEILRQNGSKKPV